MRHGIHNHSISLNRSSQEVHWFPRQLDQTKYVTRTYHDEITHIDMRQKETRKRLTFSAETRLVYFSMGLEKVIESVGVLSSHADYI